MAAWKRGGLLLPVDSEHSAVFQCLEGRAPDTVESVVPTASGGPFRNRSLSELEAVSVEEALDHPTWSMGPKITIDSATLANKGLELIEAHFLFELPYDRIEVVAPELRRACRRASATAPRSLTSGTPTCASRSAFALTYPERASTPVPGLDLRAGLTLEFEAPDTGRFPLLRLAREAGERGGTYPCALNAANEVAVAAFLEGRIGFLEIAGLVEDALARVDGAPARDLDEPRRRRLRCPSGRSGKIGSGMSNARLRLAFAGDPCSPRAPHLRRSRGASRFPAPFPAHDPGTGS